LNAIAQDALAAALAAGADYADARLLTVDSEDLAARRGRVADVSRHTETGLSVRVLAGGAWGFAATADLDADSVAAAARRAVALARAGAALRAAPVQLAPEPVHRSVWATPVLRDPASVAIADKLALLLEVVKRLEEHPGVAVGEASMSFRRERQWLLTSEGSEIDQTLSFAGADMAATSVGPGGVQRRSYPNSWGQFITGGYELIDELDLPAHVDEIAAEVAALQTADPCPQGRFDVIIDPRQLALQIHESVGHPLELDRVLGGEANYAGTSFATTDKLGHLRYGSPLVNFTADATLPRGLATFGFDDEGVAAQKWSLVKDGLLTGYFSPREYASAIGESRGRGVLRADGWHHVPIVRMVNLSLEPGPEDLSLDDLIADTKHGLLLSTNRSWSIDQRRVNFQFGCEAAWEIRDGKRGRLLRDPVYHGLTTEFWGSCDAICGPSAWEPWGVANCGKGQPAQVAEMTHGSSPARFRAVACGAA
jgi:TldD protein